MLVAGSTITDTQGIVALAAAALATLALLAGVLLWLSVRRLRAAQRVLLGEQGARDLVTHATEIQQAFTALRAYVEEAAANLEHRVDGVERGLEGAVQHRALVRYDAYNELSGKQSLSIALLDATRSGVVLTCIHHRDQARVYAKQVRRGESELALSPEEDEAVRMALSEPVDAGALAPS